MGRYEAVTNEPVNYSVAGELSVVRYTSIAKAQNMSGAAANGNGLGNVDFTTGGKASDHINPGNMLLSQTWDLSVYQKSDGADQEFITIKDCRFNRKSAGINKRGILVDRLAFVGIVFAIELPEDETVRGNLECARIESESVRCI